MQVGQKVFFFMTSGRKWRSLQSRGVHRWGASWPPPRILVLLLHVSLWLPRLSQQLLWSYSKCTTIINTYRYNNHHKLVARQPLLNHVLRKSQDPKLSWGSVKTSSRTSRTGGYHINGSVVLQTRQKPGINSLQHVTRGSKETSLVALVPSLKHSLNSKCFTR